MKIVAGARWLGWRSTGAPSSSLPEILTTKRMDVGSIAMIPALQTEV